LILQSDLPRVVHEVPQTILDAHVVRHSIVSRKRPAQGSSGPVRIRQTTFILVLANRRLRRSRYESWIVFGAGGVVVDTHVAVAAADFDHACVHSPSAVPAARLLIVDGGRINSVVAMALLRVLDAAQTVASAVAYLLAESDGHECIVGDKVGSERTVTAGTVVEAAEIFLLGRRVGVAHLWPDRGQ